jgi:hypothetical protein
MDDAQTFRAPRTLWLALVALALGVVWFLCGGAPSASASTTVPDVPPTEGTVAGIVLHAPVDSADAPIDTAIAVASDPALAPVTAVAALAAEPLLAPIVDVVAPVVAPLVGTVVAATETDIAPTVAAVVDQIPAVSIPVLSIPVVSLPTVDLPVVSDPALSAVPVIPAIATPAAPALVSLCSPAVATVDGDSGAPTEANTVASLTAADAAASAAGDPFGASGHPVNLPQPAPSSAGAAGTGAPGLVTNVGSGADSSFAAARQTPGDDALPSSPSTDPGSSPA